MNKLFHRPFTRSALCELGSALGSDIPYCINGSTALCTGRGEKLEYISHPHIHTVVAIANEFVSTAEAYSSLDKFYGDFKEDNASGGRDKYSILASALVTGKIAPEGLFNAFEAAVLPKCKGARVIKEKMIELGASAALMSGSGPSVFGVFESAAAASYAAAQLQDCGFRAYAAQTV